MSELDNLVCRVLRLNLRAKSRYEPLKITDADAEKMHENAVKIAEDCIALLKNDGILPLSSNAKKKILVAGYLAENPVIAGSGSGFMNGYRTENPINALKALGFQIDYCAGYDVSRERPPAEVDENPALSAEATEKAKNADIVIAFVGSSLGYESESYDRAHLRLPKSQQEMLDSLSAANKNLVIALNSGSAYELGRWEKNARAVLYSAFSGEGYGEAIAEIIAGNAEPGGRLAETFPIYEENTPSFFNFTPSFYESNSVTFGEGILTGYRWYDTRKISVLYPFGHGLSYTSFLILEFRSTKPQ